MLALQCFVGYYLLVIYSVAACNDTDIRVPKKEVARRQAASLINTDSSTY
jgi:hypothetical protein